MMEYLKYALLLEIEDYQKQGLSRRALCFSLLIRSYLNFDEKDFNSKHKNYTKILTKIRIRKLF